MDSSDPEIVFNNEGVCNHCTKFDEETSKRWFPNSEGEARLKNIFEKIKKDGDGKEYDCILGLSGGLDSAYLALILKEHDLRPLVVHVDAGWNSELAVYNIEQILKYCDFELYTYVMNWEEVKDLQISYLKAGVANQDVVQDHAFFSTLYQFAMKNNIKYVINGGNIATEAVFPSSWHHSAMDAINILDIHKKFGKVKLKTYKTISFWKYYIYFPFVKKMTPIRPLNYLPYSKSLALSVLKDKVGYKEYGRKHGESRFTKFFQNYYLPKKFNQDKRRPHLSSQILSGEISRDDALILLSKPLYEENELREDKAFIAKKLDMSESDLDKYIAEPGKHYSDYKNWDSLYRKLKQLQETLQKILGKSISKYG